MALDTVLDCSLSLCLNDNCVVLHIHLTLNWPDCLVLLCPYVPLCYVCPHDDCILSHTCCSGVSFRTSNQHHPTFHTKFLISIFNLYYFLPCFIIQFACFTPLLCHLLLVPQVNPWLLICMTGSITAAAGLTSPRY